MSTYFNVKRNIYKLSAKELMDINDVIRDRYKTLKEQEALDKRMELKKGDTIVFDNKRGETITGEIIKINRKTLICKEKDTTKTWKVDISLVTRKRERK